MSVPRHFDQNHLRRVRRRAAGNLSNHDFLLTWARRQIEDRLKDVKRMFPLALQTDMRGGIVQSDAIGRLVHMDTTEKFLQGGVAAAEELLPFAAATFDLVLSPFSLHTANDLPGALIQMRRALKPDGLLLAALPGGRTLHELRASLMQAELNIKGGAGPRVAPFADAQQLAALMQRAGFALPVVDSDSVNVTYSDMFSLMRDLRGMGESNPVLARQRSFTGRRIMEEAARLYHENFSAPAGRIAATFEIIFLTGWAPHESQQKPLRRGSAEYRLADVLNSFENQP